MPPRKHGEQGWAWPRGPWKDPRESPAELSSDQGAWSASVGGWQCLRRVRGSHGHSLRRPDLPRLHGSQHKRLSAEVPGRSRGASRAGPAPSGEPGGVHSPSSAEGLRDPPGWPVGSVGAGGSAGPEEGGCWVRISRAQASGTGQGLQAWLNRKRWAHTPLPGRQPSCPGDRGLLAWGPLGSPQWGNGGWLGWEP